MKHTFPLRRKLFVSHFAATFAVSSAIGVFLYVNARESILEQLRVRLSSTAAIVSRDLDADDLRDIRSPEDITKREYRDTLAALRRVESANQDIAFLYVMRQDRDGKVLFVVDSDVSKAQALPGRVYDPRNSRLLEGFDQPVADKTYTSDEWGSFISGYAPIVNSDGDFLVGIDMRADDAKAKLDKIHQAGLLGLVAALGLSWGMGTWMSRHFRRPIEAVIAQCQAIASGNLDQRLDMSRFDEMDSLISAINSMTSDLRMARDENLRLASTIENGLGQRDGKPDR